MSLYFILFLVSLCTLGERCTGTNITITGSPEWDDLLVTCWRTSSFSCVQQTLHRSLEKALDGDFRVTESINFVKNHNKYTAEANSPRPTSQLDRDNDDDDINELEDQERFDEFVNAVETSEDEEAGNSPNRDKTKPRSSDDDQQPVKNVNGISDLLYNRGVRYLMTHDLKLDFPETVFGGGRLRVSPRSIEADGGVLVKLNFDDPVVVEDEATVSSQGEGRLFLKKIKQIFKKKLMTSMMAAMLIIKLVKVKLMFLLPLIVGVGTAKKILLKVLLFLFPALTHLFKLCAYYHHHHVKWSHHLHHHHGSAHHYHHPPAHIYVPPASSSYEYDHPPPGATIVHRSEPIENELTQWGITYEEPKDEDHSLNRVFSVNQPQSAPQQSPAYRPPAAAPPVVVAAAAPATPAPANLPLVAEDPFYSPILFRLDRVFAELGFNEEPCKERLVCSMYKAPARFSPHSNLVSAEISRDPSELQKPLFENSAVLRFFRYVQAARNGQDMKDCLALYPKCSLLTE